MCIYDSLINENNLNNYRFGKFSPPEAHLMPPTLFEDGFGWKKDSTRDYKNIRLIHPQIFPAMVSVVW